MAVCGGYPKISVAGKRTQNDGNLEIRKFPLFFIFD
jgi:hypothetical protein